jgi:hypothetical protein
MKIDSDILLGKILADRERLKHSAKRQGWEWIIKIIRDMENDLFSDNAGVARDK